MLKLEIIQGESFRAGTSTLTPSSRRLSLGWPESVRANKGFALIFQQPAAIIVEKDGHIVKIPIRDYQRIILLSLLLLTVVGIIVIIHFGNQEKNQ
ncbi:MAG: hypothetical protein K0B06_12900 [Brevefilum sp.]|nr:hypothetical protein [Brevefilum sp.]